MGIGVLIIAIAFAVLVIFLLKPLSKLASVLNSVQQTTDQLPSTLDSVAGQVSEVLHTSNSTLDNVNKQVVEISPVFHVIGEIGNTSNKLTSVALNKMRAMKQQTENAKKFTEREKYDGVFGLLSFIYFLSQRKVEIKKQVQNLK